MTHMISTDVTNRYAPPTARLDDSAEFPLRRRSLMSMALLGYLFPFIYPPIWLLRERRALNMLDSEKTVSPWPAILLLSLGLEQRATYPLTAWNYTWVPDWYYSVDKALWMFQFVVLVTFMFELLTVKKILEQHLSARPNPRGPAAEPVALSTALTLFLSIFYLQHLINRDVVAKGR